ncbi:MAG: type II toxin-antitoxin system RelE/ParE family toxin [Chloroflexi bacterium]|nr:type II toxin-antitoxin system RelE/ParE family toxin [Chloroflexota bacterium]
MALYTVRILKAASRDLSRLDKPVVKRIVARIRWLADNLDNARPKALKGDLAGLFKLREGDYRIIYEFIKAEKVIIIHSIGHRREVYQKKKK